MYRQARSPELKDLVVIDADGNPVPTAVFAPEQPLARATRRLSLPWSALPSTAAADGRAWSLVSEADADGRLRRVEARMSPGMSDDAPRTALLIDLSRVREPVNALVLHWEPVEALDLGYRIEASDDLEYWQAIAARGRLVDLQREGRRLLQRRIDLFGLMPHYQRARYLRLTPDRSDAVFRITGVEAELASTAPETPMRWIELTAAPMRIDERAAYAYTLEGPFPVRAVDVALPGNHAVRWQLHSRADERAPWQGRIYDGMTWRLAPATRSQARALGTVVRDRHWRLGTDGAAGALPRLRLGCRPEVVVFVAQGRPPYALAAGSARASRAEAPLGELVAAVRRQRGEDWQPAPAYLGPPQMLAGDAALEAPRDWKTWLLWGVLVLGALLVAGFALSLLRRPRAAGSAA